MNKLVVSFLIFVCLTGCSHHRKKHSMAEAEITTAAVNLQAMTESAPVNNGTIYQESSATPLWEDQRARRVGDILTVVLQESTSSSKTSKSGINKNTSVELPAPVLLGGAQKLATNFSGQNSFKGDSQADQSNRLTGLVTVTIIKVLSNGALMIQGEKHITLTRGEEVIRIKGVVRPADITTDNTVLSSKVADSRITYSGTGEFADANHVGWLTRVFNSPFWPF